MNRHNLKILLVDDEPDILEFISYNLTREGYHVITAADGKEAYQKALLLKPNLIVLDVLMPVMNGYETCIKLRANPEFNNTKIVFLSAIDDTTAKEFGLALEADAFISKPIRMELFLKRIETWLKPSAALST
jgi:two-component system alkaline phosphatase synthesis response regulator PhoP